MKFFEWWGRLDGDYKIGLALTLMIVFAGLCALVSVMAHAVVLILGAS